MKLETGKLYRVLRVGLRNSWQERSEDVPVGSIVMHLGWVHDDDRRSTRYLKLLAGSRVHKIGFCQSNYTELGQWFKEAAPTEEA